MKLRAILLSSFAFVLGISFFVDASFEDVKNKNTTNHVKVELKNNLEDNLNQARQATFWIGSKEFNFSGTASLVGRRKLDDGSYLYTALTAYHVIDDMSISMQKDKTRTDTKLDVLFQFEFHGAPERFKVDVNDIEWALPSQDWAIFTFKNERKLICAQIATREEFKSIKGFEPIYGVGCGGGFPPTCRMGVIGGTSNEHFFKTNQIINGIRSWDKNPLKFFRPFFSGWYGDSGGAIYNKHGKLIGIINGYNVMMAYRVPATHMMVAYKAHNVLDIMSYNKEYFVVED